MKNFNEDTETNKNIGKEEDSRKRITSIHVIMIERIRKHRNL